MTDNKKNLTSMLPGIRCDAKLEASLRAMADAEGRTLSNMVRIILVREVEAWKEINTGRKIR